MARRLPLIILIWFLTDLYFYQVILTLFGASPFTWIYWLADLFVVGGILVAVFATRGSRIQHALIPWMMGLLLLLLVPRLFSLPVLMIEDLTRLFRGLPHRLAWVSELTLALAGILFLVVLFGITRGRRYYRVRRETLYFPDLPEAFDGFTITQITDVHAGSFTNANGVQKGLDLVNKQQSDVILFTGDLVNNKADEMNDFIEAFAGLKAPMGKYSILGNHDYGDYVKWENGAAKRANLDRLKQIHTEMGFRLLLDESVRLTKAGEAVALIGVENWGKSFQQYGDLKKAIHGVPDDAFKILMSHDPTHWEAATLKHDQHIHLTLAGHTHGAQFGIDFLGFKWSPVKYVYKQWVGLYENAGRYLYVNRGFGFIGLKGRIGMWAEVAVITLRRQKKSV